MTDQQAIPTLFDDSGVPRDPLLTTMDALVAPVAADAGAITDDLADLEITDAIYEAFSTLDSAGGLTRAEITEMCADRFPDRRRFDARFEVLLKLGALLPMRAKRWEQRFIFNPTSSAGLMILERLSQRGGMSELVALLDTTRQAIERGTASKQDVQRALRRARTYLSNAADYLLRAVAGSPIDELIRDRRQHQNNDAIPLVQRLNELVDAHWPELDELAHRAVVEGLRYLSARDAFVGRLMQHGASARDFRLLASEDYLTAARRASLDDLAQLATTIAFDAGVQAADPDMIVKAVQSYRTTPIRTRTRPPRPTVTASDKDPIQAAAEKSERRRNRLGQVAELHLEGRPEADLTSRLRAGTWESARTILGDLIAADVDQQIPFTLCRSTALLVDPDGPVSYVTPVTLRRNADPSDELGSDQRSAPVAEAVSRLTPTGEQPR